jgi:hypothetical protein
MRRALKTGGFSAHPPSWAVYRKPDCKDTDYERGRPTSNVADAKTGSNRGLGHANIPALG